MIRQFISLVERVKSKGKKVEVCYFKDCVSNDLLKIADKTHLINKKIVRKFFYKTK